MLEGFWIVELGAGAWICLCDLEQFTFPLSVKPPVYLCICWPFTKLIRVLGPRFFFFSFLIDQYFRCSGNLIDLFRDCPLLL
jgi:hypothetical protein